jgi:hypothetical protein
MNPLVKSSRENSALESVKSQEEEKKEDQKSAKEFEEDVLDKYEDMVPSDVNMYVKATVNPDSPWYELGEQQREDPLWRQYYDYLEE